MKRHTDREGQYQSGNHQAKEMLELAKQEVRSAQYSKIKNTTVSVKNEVHEMLAKVADKSAKGNVKNVCHL